MQPQVDGTDDEDDDIDFGPFGDDDGEGVTAEQRALLASFESVHRDAHRRQALAAEEQARADVLAMRRAYVHNDLAGLAWKGQDHPRIDRENRELEEPNAVRDNSVAAAARDRNRYHAELTVGAHWDSAMAEVQERHRREAKASHRRMSNPTKLELSRLRRARRKAAKARKRKDDGAGPSGHDDADPSGDGGGEQ